MSVVFDGINKEIRLQPGKDNYDVRNDLYIPWKRWQLDNLQFLPAFRVLGGDPISAEDAMAIYFFLMNGWKIRPRDEDHELTISGNLSIDGGLGNLFLPSVSQRNIVISRVVPLQAQGVIVTQPTSVGKAMTQEQEAKLDNLTAALLETRDLYLAKLPE